MRPLGSPPFKQTAWRRFKCKVCGVEFKCSRIDREYCGATCRQRERRLKLAATAASADPRKANGMVVKPCAAPGHILVDHLTANRSTPVKGKLGKKKPRSSTRSKPTKKGAKKK